MFSMTVNLMASLAIVSDGRHLEFQDGHLISPIFDSTSYAKFDTTKISYTLDCFMGGFISSTAYNIFSHKKVARLSARPLYKMVAIFQNGRQNNRFPL